MTEIVINAKHGGFNISHKANAWLESNSTHNFSRVDWYRPDVKIRTHPDVIRMVRILGAEANGMCALLKIIDIPDNVDVEIEEYDGLEWVSEKHRRWGNEA